MDYDFGLFINDCDAILKGGLLSLKMIYHGGTERTEEHREK